MKNKKSKLKKIPNTSRMFDIMSDEGVVNQEFGTMYQPSNKEIIDTFEEYKDWGWFKNVPKSRLSKAYTTRKPTKSTKSKKKRGKTNGKKKR